MSKLILDLSLMLSSPESPWEDVTLLRRSQLRLIYLFFTMENLFTPKTRLRSEFRNPHRRRRWSLTWRAWSSIFSRSLTMPPSKSQGSWSCSGTELTEFLLSTNQKKGQMAIDQSEDSIGNKLNKFGFYSGMAWVRANFKQLWQRNWLQSEMHANQWDLRDPIVHQ